MMRKAATTVANESGLTFLSVAIALVLATLAVAWGVSLLRPLGEPFLRQQTLETMDEIRRALYVYTAVNGTLPAPPDSDLVLPPGVLGVKTRDHWGREWKFQADPLLLGTRWQTCNTLKGELPWSPAITVWNGETGTLDPGPVAAVLISAGPSNADGQKDSFDAVGEGDNTDGPTYARASFGDTFDDLTVYVTAAQLYPWLKGPAVNQSAFNWISCLALHCNNTVQDSSETGVDCGGNDCPPCTSP